jgi:hypothetical protein
MEFHPQKKMKKAQQAVAHQRAISFPVSIQPLFQSRPWADI